MGIQIFLNSNTGLGIVRGQVLFLILTIVLVTIQVLFIKKREAFLEVVNIFFILLTGITALSAVKQTQASTGAPKFQKYNARGMHILPVSENEKPQPVLLIIADEYSSPVELYKACEDSSVFEFSKKLGQNGWNCVNSIKSRELSTINSVSSLFNFNLSESSEYKNATLFKASEYLQKPALLDTLSVKGVSFANLSIFDISSHNAFTRLYPYPRNFIELIFYKSALTLILSRINGLIVSGQTLDYTVVEEHNYKLLQAIPDTLKSMVNKKVFAYSHLYMPHRPIRFRNEINIKGYSLSDYKQYWSFSNKKLLELIRNILPANSCKIILIGDHGLRNTSQVDPTNTFAAFYGFDKSQVEKIGTVQDIGFLIAAQF